MQLNHLKYILKVAELGSITKAAHELYISQPSLTKTISNLEKQYNIKIFERTATGVSVTSEGRHFLYYAKNVVHSVNSLERSFQDSFYINQIQLFVATQTLDFIPQVVLNTYKKYSNHNLKFEVYESHRSNVIKAIQKRDCNIGLIVQTNKETKAFDWQLTSTNLETEYLASDTVYILLGPKSSLYHAASITFQDLETLSHICLSIDELTRSEWQTHKQHLYINLNHVIYCNSIHLCIELLENTDAVLYASKWILKYFKNTNIKALPISNNDIYESNLICIKRKNEPLTPIKLHFIDEVKNSINPSL